MQKSIKNWHHQSRPREKLENLGADKLTDTELLAILLGSGSGESALDLASRVLTDVAFQWLKLSALGLAELRAYKGIGHAKSILIAAAIEMGKRIAQSTVPENAILNSSRLMFQAIGNQLRDKQQEEFWVILLNHRLQKIGAKMISLGGQSQVEVDPKVVFRYAIQHAASSIALFHNHPSGGLHPSKNDRALTKRMEEAGRLLQIRVVDHLIIGKNDYYSFADNGLMT